jgi:hypothetical protein
VPQRLGVLHPRRIPRRTLARELVALRRDNDDLRRRLETLERLLRATGAALTTAGPIDDP